MGKIITMPPLAINDTVGELFLNKKLDRINAICIGS
jgi:hypothetical protein